MAECFQNVPHRLEITAIFTQKAFQPRFLGALNKQFEREVGTEKFLKSVNLWVFFNVFSQIHALEAAWLIERKPCFVKKYLTEKKTETEKEIVWIPYASF